MKEPGKISQVHNIYSLDEFNQFLSAEDDFRFRCLWLMLYYCRLRIGEARGLQWKDIDWNTNTIWVNKQVQSIDNYSATWFICDLKTKSSNRKLVMCDALANDLKLYYEQVTKFTNYSDEFFVFGESHGITPLTYSKAQKRKKKIAELADVKQIRLHDFRHSCASLLIYSGAYLFQKFQGI